MSSKKGRKRPHGAPEENRAECPFTVTTKPTNVDSAKHDIVQPSKNSKNKESQGGRKMIGGLQTSPFKVQGKFETNQTMNVRYVVEPRDQWESLSRYNSFVLNGQKYQTEDFVFVANENTVELQKQGHQAILNPRASNFWVGQILEIRAADDHHVYARIYWMYSPDELWPNTRDRNMTISGRQPYHGAHELIASNHMEVINVLSVSAEAKVNHWVESNDDDTQEALYWRQGYDIRSSELSTVQLMCKCKTPGNPDKTLIGCTDTACGTWMHHECLKDAVLTKIYERLGNDKPHIPVVKKEPEDEPMPIINGVEMGQQQQHQHQQEPLSPRELKSEEREATMDVKSSEKPPTDIIIPPKSKKITPPTETPTPKETTPKDMDTVMEESIIAPMGKPPRKIAPVKKGRGRKPANRKPYEGLFEATLRLTEIPVTWDITDLRTGVEGVKTWTEYAECLVCGTTIE